MCCMVWLYAYACFHCSLVDWFLLVGQLDAGATGLGNETRQCDWSYAYACVSRTLAGLNLATRFEDRCVLVLVIVHRTLPQLGVKNLVRNVHAPREVRLRFHREQTTK